MAKIRETKIYQIFGCISLWKTVRVWEEAGKISELCPIRANRSSKKSNTKEMRKTK